MTRRSWRSRGGRAAAAVSAEVPYGRVPVCVLGALAGPLRRACLLDLCMSISSRES